MFAISWLRIATSRLLDAGRIRLICRQFNLGHVGMAGRAGAFVGGLLSVLPVLAVPSPATAGPPFLTDDPEPVEYGHWEVIGFSMGTMVQGDSAGLLPAVDINYGVLPDVQLHVTLPVAFNSQDVTGTELGYGDTEFGVKYRFIEPGDSDWWPQIAVYPTVVISTGDAARGLGTGATHVFLPLWMQKDLGRWTIDAGGGYWINPGSGNQNYWFLGELLQRKITDKLSLGGELFHQTASTTGGPGNVGFPLGSQVTTGFNFGGTYDFTDHYHFLFSAGRGIQNVTTSDQFSYYVGFQWAF